MLFWSRHMSGLACGIFPSSLTFPSSDGIYNRGDKKPTHAAFFVGSKQRN